MPLFPVSRGLTIGRACTVMALLLPIAACAATILRCEISYAGTSHILDAAPTVDPYGTESVDIGGRFRFKAVVIGDNEKIDLIKLYAYYYGKRQPVLLQTARYTGPFTVSSSPHGLTGLNQLYAPPLSRELQYGCAVMEAKQ
ncbi:MAG: hypothetical protein JWQ00_2176 [Noviherbaspirillum sp.]|nr:hypothetical protein [Noviherbaspirillum sp.]